MYACCPVRAALDQVKNCMSELDNAFNGQQPVDIDVKFGRGGWDSREWIRVKSPRWGYIGEWVQQDDHIHNRIPADAKPDQYIEAPHAYTSMVYGKPVSVGQGVEVTVRMEFDYDQGPQIVLAPELGADENGFAEYREHHEVVLFSKGINVWRHTYHEGKPQWGLAAYARFPLKPRTPYDLTVRVEPASAYENYGKYERVGNMIVVGVNGGKTFAYHEPHLAERLHIGFIGYASLNRFYSFKLRRVDAQ